MENKSFRVAIVGCGVISGVHLDALEKLQGVEVVALVDTNEQRAISRKEEFSLGAGIYTDYITMLDEVKPDAVHICTPHYLHCPMAVEALKRGINVFLEKPIGISNEEIEALLEAERKSSARVCVCFQNRFNEATRHAKRLIEEDGGALAAYATLHWYRGERYYTDSGWRGKIATEGGGVMINQAIHTIDLLCFFLGNPKKVCATTANHHLKGVIEVEDTCEGIITFESGVRANFHTTTAYEGGDSITICLKTKNHTVEIRPPRLYLDGEPYALPEGTDEYRGKRCYGNGHLRVIEAFYSALRDGVEMPIPLSTATDALRIIFASYKSQDNDIEIL